MLPLPPPCRRGAAAAAVGALFALAAFPGGSRADSLFACEEVDVVRVTDVADSPSCRPLQPSVADRARASADASRRQPSAACAPPHGHLRRLAETAGARYGLPVGLLSALVDVESAYRVDAVSGRGAMGLAQLMPATARELGVRQAFDAAENLDAGARHLRRLLDLTGGDVPLALAAYNAGEGTLARHGWRVPPIPETREYVQRVQVRWMQARC